MSTTVTIHSYTPKGDDYFHLIGLELPVIQDKGKTVVIRDPLNGEVIEINIEDCTINQNFK